MYAKLFDRVEGVPQD